ncbi:MAG TPA: hypothetical protein VGH87_13525 [Polyangiaceae bacterium]
MKYAAFLVFVSAFGCSRAPEIAADHPAPLASTIASNSAAVSEPPAPPPTTTTTAAPPPPIAMTADEEDLREATFRHMFKKNASGMQQSAKVFCLEFEKRGDPSPSFLGRFAHDAIPVRAGSECTQDARSGVVDKKTNARGLAFRIDAVKYTDKDHATVNGGYYEAGLSASGNVYTLERQKGAWVVVKDEMTWIS